MAKLTLDDLASLFPKAVPSSSSNSVVKTGYDGKPQKLKVVLDTKRKGKTVTIISGFQSNPDELDTIAQSLKKACGAGGQVLDNVIEIQGDHRAKAIEKLRAMGFTVA